MDYDALEKLVKLRDSGALTEQEFAEQKTLLNAAAPRADYGRIETREPTRARWRRPLALTGIATVVVAALTFTYFRRSDLSNLLGSVAPEELQCQASIRSSLINPETAQFFEFESTSPERYIMYFEEKASEHAKESMASLNVGSSLTGVYADYMAAEKERIAASAVREAVSQERQKISENASKIFTYRVKAEGKLGNTITTTNFCVVSSNSCECM